MKSTRLRLYFLNYVMPMAMAIGHQTPQNEMMNGKSVKKKWMKWAMSVCKCVCESERVRLSAKQTSSLVPLQFLCCEQNSFVLHKSLNCLVAAVVLLLLLLFKNKSLLLNVLNWRRRLMLNILAMPLSSVSFLVAETKLSNLWKKCLFSHHRFSVSVLSCFYLLPPLPFVVVCFLMCPRFWIFRHQKLVRI